MISFRHFDYLTAHNHGSQFLRRHHTVDTYPNELNGKVYLLKHLERYIMGKLYVERHFPKVCFFITAICRVPPFTRASCARSFRAARRPRLAIFRVGSTGSTAALMCVRGPRSCCHTRTRADGICRTSRCPMLSVKTLYDANEESSRSTLLSNSSKTGVAGI